MKKEYRIIEEVKTEFPVRKLLKVPHKKENLTVGYPSFGPNHYKTNIEEMSKSYSHPLTGKKITFRPATTSESISAVSYDFENLAKKDIFDPRWLQAGYIVRTKDGVFTNTTVKDESKLKELLNGTKKVNGIYLIDEKVAFVPYESFERGVQDCDTFAYGGLARALEHTEEKSAKNLRGIASPKLYKKGVNVWGFEEVKNPILRVVLLFSGGGVDDGRLSVNGDNWGGDVDGHSFGVSVAD